MCQIPKQAPDPNVLLGLDVPDDAGVYKLTDEIAIIQTLDFFTPVVDDPYQYGQIAAANSLSDVYAMGGQPITAMNIVGYPIKKLPPHVLAEILRGAFDKVNEAGARIIGGHSVDDQEPKFGLSVTGIVHPDQFWTIAGAKPGDKIILTKPIGVGAVTTGIKRGKVPPELEEHVTKVMATLNKYAYDVLKNYDVHACTDVTGFGLVGHAREMAEASQVTFQLWMDQIPILEGTYDLAALDVLPGGSKANLRFLAPVTRFNQLQDVEPIILCDAVTSGGLLVSLPPDQAEDALMQLHQQGVTDAQIIGEVSEREDVWIAVNPTK